jgi:glycosyltransferase involved in cell wall biosynthesis
MITETPLVSICIPSYNRPYELKRLLESVDYSTNSDLELIICEDKSPKHDEIEKVVNEYIDWTDYHAKFYRNEENLGYDKNLRRLIELAHGRFIIFMGDDDFFVPSALDPYINFLRQNQKLGYILKTHRVIYPSGEIEIYKYFKQTVFFNEGVDTYIKLFRKSVFISGFTINREYISPFVTDELDGTLLYQLYLLAEVTLRYKSAYCDIPLTEQYFGGTPYFGMAKAEKDLYVPGKITMTNSINFSRGFSTISNYMDKKYNISSSEHILKDMSKYSYPFLAIQRKNGLFNFIKYTIELSKLGLNKTIYFYIYAVSLSILGDNISHRIIRLIKRVLGRTPHL